MKPRSWAPLLLAAMLYHRATANAEFSLIGSIDVSTSLIAPSDGTTLRHALQMDKSGGGA